MHDFDERDLLRYAENAGFAEVRLDLVAPRPRSSKSAREEAPVDQLAMGRLDLALYGRGVLVALGHREELPQGVSMRTNVLRRVLRPPDVRNSW